MRYSLWVFTMPDGRLLAEMAEEGPVPTYGAVVPGRDGNYYRHIIVTGLYRGKFGRGATEFLRWLRDPEMRQPRFAAKPQYEISYEFPFDPDKLRIKKMCPWPTKHLREKPTGLTDPALALGSRPGIGASVGEIPTVNRSL